MGSLGQARLGLAASDPVAALGPGPFMALDEFGKGLATLLSQGRGVSRRPGGGPPNLLSVAVPRAVPRAVLPPPRAVGPDLALTPPRPRGSSAS